MAISKSEVIDLMNRFHHVVMIEKGSAAAQASFFLRPESAMIYIPHGDDVSLEANYEIHQKLTDEMHVPMQAWDITPLCEKPERARAIGAVYWQGRLVGSEQGALIKCVVGEDWIVERAASGELKIALYINPYHHFLPDSAPIDLTRPTAATKYATNARP